MTSFATSFATSVAIRDLGRTDYHITYDAMKLFTNDRDAQSLDQIWLTEHEAVFTQGQAGKAEHLLAPGDIPVVQTDRGGQVTYHGPGQITAYLMFDLRRLGLGVRDLVTKIETSMVGVLKGYGIDAAPRADAPGVYVEGKKIGSLGLRVRRGYCYHGLSLNVDMDLEPFTRINPCGLFGMEVTQIADFVAVSITEVQQRLVDVLLEEYGLSASRNMDNP